MTPDIREFFERYRDAFNALDGEAVARLYAVPSGIAQDGNYTHWPDYALIRENMVALCKLYRERGFKETTFDPLTFLQQSNDYAIADLRWTISWVTGAEPWRFGTTYNLVRTGEGWQVLLCTAYSESALHKTTASSSN